MLCDKLKSNDNKTEVIIIDTRQKFAKVQVECLTAAKNLGTWINTVRFFAYVTRGPT